MAHASMWERERGRYRLSTRVPACARGTATGGAKEMHARPVVVVGRAPRARAGRQYRQGSMRALCVHHRVDGGFHSARFGASAGGPPTRLNKMLLP